MHLKLATAMNMLGAGGAGSERGVADGFSFYLQCLIFSNECINYQYIPCIIKINTWCGVFSFFFWFFSFVCLWGVEEVCFLFLQKQKEEHFG